MPSLILTIILCPFQCRLVHARKTPIFADGDGLCPRRRVKAGPKNDDGWAARHDVNRDYAGIPFERDTLNQAKNADSIAHLSQSTTAQRNKCVSYPSFLYASPTYLQIE